MRKLVGTEATLYEIFKHARNRYPEYKFGYHVRPDIAAHEVGAPEYVDMSVMFKKPRFERGNAVRIQRLDIGKPKEWYAEKWVQLLEKLDPKFKRATQMGEVARKPNIPDETEATQDEDRDSAQERVVGGILPVHKNS